MNLIPMTEVVPEFLPEVHGCPQPVAVRALRNTWMEFCRYSEAWHYRNEFFPTVEGLGEIEVPLPDDTRLIKVLSMEYKGRVLQPSSDKVLDNMVPNWRKQTGEPRTYIELSGSRLRLAPIPNQTDVGSTTVTVAISPTRNATMIDEDLWDEWLEGIIAGVLSRLKSTTGQTWSDPGAALELRQEFDTAIMHARRYSRNDHQAKPRYTSYGGY